MAKLSSFKLLKKSVLIRVNPWIAFVFSASSLFRISSLVLRISGVFQALSFMQNEPNFRPFKPKNKDSEKKRTQSNPKRTQFPTSSRPPQTLQRRGFRSSCGFLGIFWTVGALVCKIRDSVEIGCIDRQF